MRNVPELRFDGFDGEWEEKKLSKIAKFSKGKGYSKNDLSNGKYPIYLYGQMYINYKSQINEIETYTDSIKVNSILSKGNEVLIPSSGETAEDLARASHMNISNVLLGGDLNIIEPIDGVNSHFLALELSNGSVKRSLSKKAQGKSVVHLYNSDIKNQKINYTKFEEQEKIGDLFKKIDALIEIQEGKVSKMEDFKKSMLQKMFPKKGELVPEIRFDGFDDKYNEAYLLEIGENIKGSTYSKKDVEEGRGNSQLIHYGMMFTEYSSIIIESPYKVIEKPNSVKSKVGDLIMPASSTTSDNEIVTASAVAKEGIIYGGDINIIRTNDIDLALYLSYYITGTELKNFIFKNVQGTTIHHLYFSSLKNITVKLPPAEEQRTINRFFRNIEKEIAVEEKLLESYKMMKKSLLQKMFV